MADPEHDRIADVLRLHWCEILGAYRNNVISAMNTVQSGWLPEEGDKGVAEHVETLRRHMAEIGSPEEDGFLLRLGLTVPGRQRGITPPLMVLDTDRGGFSKRRQGEAGGQIRRLHEALLIGRQLMPSLHPDTRQALTELAVLFDAMKEPGDADWLDTYSGLSSDDAGRLERHAFDLLDGEDDENVSDRGLGAKILQPLACFRQTPLSQATCRELIERDMFWPASLFRDAGDVVASLLVDRINQGFDRLVLDHLLLSLAWTRSFAAEQAFRRWVEQRPEWTAELHMAPEDYAIQAGWCLDQNGRRRDLTSTRCFRLIPNDGVSQPIVRCRAPYDGRCSSCGGILCWLFDFTRLGFEFFVDELAGAPRRVLYCPYCSCYKPVFTSYGEDASAQWLSPTSCETANDHGWQPTSRDARPTPCPPFACAEPFNLADATTFGGVPMWLQDADYPRCIRCRRVMTFLAQHDNSPSGEEGIHYAFFCGPCHVAAVGYQQT